MLVNFQDTEGTRRIKTSIIASFAVEEDPSTFASGIHSTSGETDDFLETGRRRRVPPPSPTPTATFFRISRSGQTGKKSNVARTRLP